MSLQDTMMGIPGQSASPYDGQYQFDMNKLLQGTGSGWGDISQGIGANAGTEDYSPWLHFAGSDGTPLAALRNYGQGGMATDGSGQPTQGPLQSYQVFKDPGDFGGTGFAGAKMSKMNGINYDVVDPTGKYLDKGTFSGYNDEGFGDATGVGSILAMAGGAAAGGLGGAGAGTGAAVGEGAATTLGTGAMDLGGGIGMSADGAITGATPFATSGLSNAGIMSSVGASGVGGTAAAGATGAASSGLGSFNIPGIGNVSMQQLGSLGSLISQLSGKSGSSAGGTGTGGTGTGGLDLGGILGLIGGGVDASQQGKAANSMTSWLQSQQSKIDGAYNPGTPEYNQLWDEMSRKDAAAGRNSQYGPRSVDLAAKLAGIKADATTRFTTGTSRAYADALNLNASRYAGLSAAAQRAANGTGTLNLSSILKGLGGTGGGAGMEAAAATGAANSLSDGNYAGADWSILDKYLNNSGGDAYYGLGQNWGI